MMKRYEVRKESHWVAKLLYAIGVSPGATSDIADELSLGYGRLDDYGFWQFQLYVNRQTN